MSKKGKPGAGEKKRLSALLSSWRRILLAVGAAAGAAALALGLMFVVHEARQFVLSDPRFALAPPPDFEFLSPDIKVEGLENARESSIHAVFKNDFWA